MPAPPTVPTVVDEYQRARESMPTYVLSSTLRDPQWTNSTLLSGDLVDEITKLKQEQDGNIVVHGIQVCTRS